MNTILVPLDFSDLSPQVLTAATRLVRDLSGKLVLFQVIEPITSYVPVGAAMDVIAVPPPVPVVNEIPDRQKALEALAEPLRKEGVTVEVEVVLGLPVDEILAKAKAISADYILLGSHGHGALYHLFSGSVVTGVLKQSEIPVVVIPAKRTV